MKNLNIILLIGISLILLVSITSAQVSHLASEITAGTFDAGDFTFIGDVTIDKNDFAKLIVDSGDGVTPGFSAFDFYDNGVPIWGFGKNPSNIFYIDLAKDFGGGVGNALTIDTNRRVDLFGDVSWTGTLQSPAKVPWGRLTDVPSGLSDGDQVGITSETDPQVGAVTNGQWCKGDGGAVQCNQAAPSGLKLQGYATGSTISLPNCGGGFPPAICSGASVTLPTTIATTGQYLIIAGVNIIHSTTTTPTRTHLNIDGLNIGTMSWDWDTSDHTKSTTVIRTLSAGLRTLKINYLCTASGGCTISDSSIAVLGPLG